MKIITRSAEETVSLGKRIGKLLRRGDVVAYTGGLGAGKTTITLGIAIGMGLDDEVCSPTFALVNEYAGDGISLYHFDMYRITSAEDLETTGFYEYIENGGVLAVEWSENIASELPGNTIYIDIRRVDDDTREITVTGDERFEAVGDRYLG